MKIWCLLKQFICTVFTMVNTIFTHAKLTELHLSVIVFRYHLITLSLDFDRHRCYSGMEIKKVVSISLQSRSVSPPYSWYFTPEHLEKSYPHHDTTQNVWLFSDPRSAKPLSLVTKMLQKEYRKGLNISREKIEMKWKLSTLRRFSHGYSAI